MVCEAPPYYCGPIWGSCVNDDALMDDLRDAVGCRMSHSTSVCDTEHAMDTLTDLLELFDGSSIISEEKLKSIFEELYDLSLQASILSPDEDDSKTIQRTYDELYKEVYLGWSRVKAKVEIIFMDSFVDGVIEYKIRVNVGERMGLYTSLAQVRNGKIIRVESRCVQGSTNSDDSSRKVERSPQRDKKMWSQMAVASSRGFLKGVGAEDKKVSGQVAVAPSRGFLKGVGVEAKLSASLCSPTKAFLCPDSMIQPVLMLGNVVKVVLECSQAEEYRSGIVSLETVDGERYADGVSILHHRCPSANQVSFVLRDGERNPLVLCLRTPKSHNYTFCGSTPLNSGDTPLMETSGKWMYPYFKLQHFTEGQKEYHALSIWTGNSYDRVLVIRPSSSPKRKNRRRSSSLKGSEFTVMTADEKQMYGIVSFQSLITVTRWTVAVAPGADPALMICISMAIEDYVESTGA